MSDTDFFETRNKGLADAKSEARWTKEGRSWFLYVGNDCIAWATSLEDRVVRRSVYDVPRNHKWLGQTGDLRQCLVEESRGEDWSTLLCVTSEDLGRVVRVIEREGLEAHQARAHTGIKNQDQG
jgi:hypothetical protein